MTDSEGFEDDENRRSESFDQELENHLQFISGSGSDSNGGGEQYGWFYFYGEGYDWPGSSMVTNLFCPAPQN
jgi:hypothetical protein